MKKIIYLLLSLASIMANAQTPANDTTRYSPVFGYGYNWSRGKFDSTIIIPKGDTATNPLGAPHDKGRLLFRLADSMVYVNDGVKWKVLGSIPQSAITLSGDASGTGTSTIAVAVNKLNGQLPSYYLDYNNLTNQPVIPSQFNPIAGSNVTLSGTYPNITFSASGGGGGASLNNQSYLKPYGKIYNKSYFSNTSDFTATGMTPTITSANAIRLSGGTGNFGQYMTLNNYVTCDEKLSAEITFSISAALSSSSYGIGLGKRSINTWFTSGFAVQLDLSQSAGSGVFINFWEPNAGTKINSVPIPLSSVAPSLNDIITLNLTQNATAFTVTYIDVTTGYANSYTTYAFISASPNFNTPNTSNFNVFNFGGQFDITDIKLTSQSLKDPYIVFVGDSKTVGYSAVGSTLRFADLCKTLGTTVVFAGDGDRTAEAAYSALQVVALKPKYVVLCIGRNDLASSIPSAIWEANYKSIVDSLQAAGITVFHLLPIPETAQPQTALTAWIEATYPGAYIDDQTGWSNTYYLASDNVHPNAAGHAFVANAIINSGFIPVDNTVYPDKNLYSSTLASSVDSISGTAGTVAKFLTTGSVGNSQIYQDANNNIGVNTNAPINYGTGFQNFEIRGANYGLMSLGKSGFSNEYFSVDGSSNLYIGQHSGATNYGQLSIWGATGHYTFANNANPGIGDSGYAADIYGGAVRIRNGGLRINGNDTTYGNLNIVTASGYTNVTSTNANLPAAWQMVNDANEQGSIFKQGSGTSFENIGASDLALYNYQNNISICEDNASGDINLAISSSTPQFKLTQTALTLTSLGTGTVYSNAGVLTNTNPSDRRLKHLIKPVNYGVAEIMKLQPVSFYYNTDSTNKNEQFGFIAQDVQKIMPDAVRKLNNSSSYLGLEKDAIYVSLVNAVKELQQEIDSLKKQLHK